MVCAKVLYCNIAVYNYLLQEVFESANHFFLRGRGGTPPVTFWCNIHGCKGPHYDLMKPTRLVKNLHLPVYLTLTYTVKVLTKCSDQSDFYKVSPH